MENMTVHDIYPEMVRRLCQAVDKCRAGDWSEAALQGIIGEAVDTFLSPQTRNERQFLRHIDSELETVRFMMNSKESNTKIQEILAKLEERYCENA